MDLQSSTMIPASNATPKQPDNQNSKTITPLKYDGNVADIFKIWIINLLLSILTLGIYKFWGKTNMRRYLCRGISFDNERFEYTGTGGELFKGFLKAIPFIAVLIALNIFSQDYPILLAPYFILLILLVYIAIYGSMRYKFSRTRWKGIRFSLRGKRLSYASLAIGRAILNAITLGWKIPESDQKMWGFIINNGYFGTQKMRFEPNVDWKLKKLNLITILLMIPTLGFSRIWYAAESLNRLYNGTYFGDIRLRSNFVGKNHFLFTLGNIAILIITLGFGISIILNRNMNYLSRHITVEGNLDTTRIQQAQKEHAGIGEGLDDALDIDADVDIGSFL